MNWLKGRAELLDRFWNTSGWAARLAILFLVGIAIWAMGLFWKWPQDFLSLTHFPRLEDFLKLCADPLARNLNEPIVAYRITTPIISYMLGLGPGGSVLIGWIALAASYAVCWAAMRRYCGSFFSLLIVFSLSQTFFAHYSVRWLGIPDSVTLLALAACLLWANAWIVATATVFGAMNDERFLLAAPAILIWQAVALGHEKPSWKAGARANWRLLGKALAPVGTGLLAGLCLTLIVRHALSVGWVGEGIERPEVYDQIITQPLREGGWHPFASTWSLFFFNVLSSWAWMWFYAVYLLWRGLPGISGLLTLACAIYLLASVASASTVVDVSRSMGFLFPLFLAGGLALYRSDPDRACKIAVLVALLAALTPGIYFAYQGSGAVFIPYPVDALNALAKSVFGLGPLDLAKSVVSFKNGFGG